MEKEDVEIYREFEPKGTEDHCLGILFKSLDGSLSLVLGQADKKMVLFERGFSSLIVYHRLSLKFIWITNQWLYFGDLRITDTYTTTEIRHDGTRGHDKFQKIRIRIRQGYSIIR